MMMMINTPATTMHQWCNDDDDYDNYVNDVVKTCIKEA